MPKQSEAYVKGDKFGSEVWGEATQVLPGLLSPTDKIKLDSIAGGSVSIRTEVNDYLIVPGDFFILTDATSNNVTISLPSSPVAGNTFIIKRIDGSVNDATLDTNDAALIDGAVSISLNQWDSYTVCSNGTDWFKQ